MGTFEEQLAKQVVQKALALREGEEYFIDTFQHTIPLAEALSVEAGKVGAHAHVMLATDSSYRRYLTEVPEKYLRQPSSLMLQAYDRLNAMTYLGGPEDPAIFEEMPAQRMSAMSEAEKPFQEKFLEKKIRGVGIEIGQVTPQRAKQYGLDYDAWSKAFQAALGADLTEIGKQGRALASALEGATTVHVTAKNGTDLQFEIAGRAAHLEDGVVDAEDVKKGNLFASLPAGSVSIAPRETTANGTVVFDKMALWGRVLTDVRWTFKDGKVTEASVGDNAQIWEDFYGPATGDKDRIASFTVGLNPEAKPLGVNLTDWFVSGAVGIAIGNNDFLGGTNKTGFHWNATLLGATVALDGREIIREGKLV